MKHSPRNTFLSPPSTPLHTFLQVTQVKSAVVSTCLLFEIANPVAFDQHFFDPAFWSNQNSEDQRIKSL